MEKTKKFRLVCPVCKKDMTDACVVLGSKESDVQKMKFFHMKCHAREEHNKLINAIKESKDLKVKKALNHFEETLGKFDDWEYLL